MNVDFVKALEQVQKMQEEVEKAKDALGSLTASAEAGGGMVKVVANGLGHIVSIALEKEVIDPCEQEMLEDLIVAAANRAISVAKSLGDERLESITSKMMPNLPGFPSMK